MTEFAYIDVNEQQLEELTRRYADKIEEGLRFIEHQRATDRGRLDVLFADSGRALVVAELKVVEDDLMLVQGIDYYDFLARHVGDFAHIHRDFDINPSEPIRLFLIAPSFSVDLLNRCKWIDVPISLFTYRCIRVGGSQDILPVFTEVTIPSIPETVEAYTLEARLSYITDTAARERAKEFLEEIRKWDPTRITVEPKKYDVSLKVSGRVFAYLNPRRKSFIFSVHDRELKWTGFTVNQDDELSVVRELTEANYRRLL